MKWPGSDRSIQQRRGRTEESLTRRAAENVQASIDAGTTFLADTTTAGLSWEPVAEAPLRAVVFAEVIGLQRDRGLVTDAKPGGGWVRSVPSSRWRPVPGWD